jgi:hypothetical protein
LKSGSPWAWDGFVTQLVRPSRPQADANSSRVRVQAFVVVKAFDQRFVKAEAPEGEKSPAARRVTP